MKYYNQYDYSNVSYWHASKPNATIASSGCGVCCMSMVLSSVGITVAPPEMAKISTRIGARVEGGTDMGKLSSYIVEQYGLKLTKSNSPTTLKSALSAGKIAIANVGGDRTGHKGVFSNGGHYIVVYGLTSKAEPIIYDPGYYSGKYSSAYRSERVTVGPDHQLYSTFDTLNADCSNRNPRYYIFWKEGAKQMTPEEAKKIIQDKCQLSNNTMLYLWSYRYGDELLIKLAKAMI